MSFTFYALPSLLLLTTDEMRLPDQQNITRDNEEDINGDAEQDFSYLEPQQATTLQTVSS